MFIIICFVLIYGSQLDAWSSFDIDGAANRFQVYWNVPSEVCANTSAGLIRPQDYGIRTNRQEKFYGNEIVTFYEDKLGLYPKCLYVKQKDGKYVITKRVNGGLPSMKLMDAHLAKVERDIRATIPNAHFSGLVVIDYEHWRPVFAHNWGGRGVYRVEAIERVQHDHPQLSYKASVRMAEESFNRAARKFILETLRIGKRLRPNAKWGFFDFPLCNDRLQNGSRRCSDNFIQYNNEMMWLYDEVVALFPPIYFYVKPERVEDVRAERDLVYAKIAECRRVTAILSRYIPTYLYSKNEYDVYAKEPKFYTRETRCISIGIPASYGVLPRDDEFASARNFSVQGVVIWSTSENMRRRCAAIKETMQHGLGKFLLKLLHKSTKCSEKLCSAHGRCVMHAPESSVNYILESHVCGHKPQYLQRNHNLRCLCDEGYSGEKCAEHGGDSNTKKRTSSLKLASHAN